jgi:hypothetical protein
MKNDQEPLSRLLSSRTNLIELLLIAIFVSFSISLLSGCIILTKGFDPKFGIYISIVLGLISIIYFIIHYISKREINEKLEGFFVYNSDEKVLVEVTRYDFSENLYRDMHSAFTENSALKLVWETDPLNSFMKFDEKINKYVRKEPQSAKLLKEAIEYYILETLSTHLSGYFNNDGIKEENIHEFQRNEIPDVLLSNRFLELFSKPMIERPLFAEHAIKFKEEHGKTVAMYGTNGISFRAFDLILPKKSKIKRMKDNRIEISNSRFSMTISIDFDGMNTNLPEGFEKYYLNVDDFRKFNVYEIYVNIDIKFKFLSLFSIKGWVYYKWIDSFIEELEEKISQKHFFENIQWNNVFTMIQCSKSLYEKTNSTGSSEGSEEIVNL